MAFLRYVGSFSVSVLCATLALAQPGGPPPGGGEGPPPGGRGPGGPGGFGQPDREILDQFDVDGNGRLDGEEREAARAWVSEQDANRGGGRRRGPRGPGRGQAAGPLPHQTDDAMTLDPNEVPHYPEADLYDTGVVRTLFFEFEDEHWYDQLVAFYHSDIEVPARMVVDGEEVGEVGVRFRGNSSFMAAKKSMNISIDAFENGLRLDGFKTLNLLNANGDASMMREALYAHISNQYMPAPRANFVRVVINGRYWGTYVNVEQINKDFIEHHYDTRAGVRWKVPADFSGRGGLVWHGDELAPYESAYELKTGSAGEDDWRDLIELCRLLKETPAQELPEVLPEVLDVEEALWFLALDNVLMDQDGYYSRGSDYGLYKDPAGRFHLLTYDNNEAFMVGRGGPGGFGGPGGRRGPGGRGGLRNGPEGGGAAAMRDPLEHADNPDRPLIHALLSVPEWRATYLEHVAQINREWMDWQHIGPVVERYRELIEEAVAQDPLGPGAAGFGDAIAGDEARSLQGFFNARHESLLNHPALNDAQQH
ncbi:MAG: CotH kinase family protein [Phycisphaerales bacterium JB063]